MKTFTCQRTQGAELEFNQVYTRVMIMLWLFFAAGRKRDFDIGSLFEVETALCESVYMPCIKQFWNKLLL